ncbi:MAG TPA: hypothetical protein VH988_05985 [Thermoanaerobaculia bacterium]|jgi:hypothetical protein|nr:hypothetical protein [Thermoanaerobaculia bacterium]
MSRTIVRPLLIGLALALVLALATPVHAGPRDRPVTPAVSAFMPHWVVSLLEKIGWRVDTTSAAAPPAGGDSTPSDTGSSGDIGMHVDPNG